MTAQGAVIEVRFKGNRKAFFTWSNEEEPLHLQEPVIVEAERGLDFGRINSVGDTAAKKCTSCSTGCSTGEGATEAPVIRPVNRRASQEEIRTANELRKGEEDVRRKVIQRVKEHQLEMKVSDAEWQWDRNKLTIYFTAERRVDFRQLVRDLARTFRTRIELKQIGVRDEAAQLGGVGRCGRQLCCATWLREIKPISLQLAKDQNLSLNPQQISGTCGRLMCCLTYEHDAYLQARKRFPREGKTVRTVVGAEKVVQIDIWRNRVTLQDENRQRRTIDLEQLRAETVAAPAGERPAAPQERPSLPTPQQPQRPPRRPRRGPERRPQ